MSKPKYPEIRVKLSGEDGNAFSIVVKVKRALTRAKVERSECDEFWKDALSGDYDHLIQTCMRWVTVE